MREIVVKRDISTTTWNSRYDSFIIRTFRVFLFFFPRIYIISKYYRRGESSFSLSRIKFLSAAVLNVTPERIYFRNEHCGIRAVRRNPCKPASCYYRDGLCRLAYENFWATRRHLFSKCEIRTYIDKNWTCRLLRGPHRTDKATISISRWKHASKELRCVELGPIFLIDRVTTLPFVVLGRCANVPLIKTSSRLFILSNGPDKCSRDFDSAAGERDAATLSISFLVEFQLPSHPTPCLDLPFDTGARLPFPRTERRSNNVNRFVVFLLGWQCNPILWNRECRLRKCVRS